MCQALPIITSRSFLFHFWQRFPGEWAVFDVTASTHIGSFQTKIMGAFSRMGIFHMPRTIRIFKPKGLKPSDSMKPRSSEPGAFLAPKVPGEIISFGSYPGAAVPVPEIIGQLVRRSSPLQSHHLRWWRPWRQLNRLLNKGGGNTKQVWLSGFKHFIEVFFSCYFGCFTKLTCRFSIRWFLLSFTGSECPAARKDRFGHSPEDPQPKHFPTRSQSLWQGDTSVTIGHSPIIVSILMNATATYSSLYIYICK